MTEQHYTHCTLIIEHFAQLPEIRGRHKTISLLQYLWLASDKDSMWGPSDYLEVAVLLRVMQRWAGSPSAQSKSLKLLASVGAIQKRVLVEGVLHFRLLCPAWEDIPQNLRDNYSPFDFC